MCGIVGYIGDKSAKEVIIKGLKRLEYRGYDSAGIATMESNKLAITKTSGKVNDLISCIPNDFHNGIPMVSLTIRMLILILISAASLHWFIMELLRIIIV